MASSTPIAFSLMALTVVLGLAHAQDQAAEMTVEEPSALSSPPIDPVQDAGPWVSKRSRNLSKFQKAALAERRKKVEEMAAIIREKRQALENSGVEEKADRAEELKRLILDGAKIQDDSEKGLKRLEMILEKTTKVKDKQLEKKLEQIEKGLEKKLEKLEKDRTEKEGKSKPDKPGK